MARFAAASLIAGAMCLLCGQAALAQESEAEFYKNKTISIVVGTTPGTVNDTLARVIAHHMPRHIPGEPKFLVRNMPGAGGLMAAQYVSAVAKKDGTEFGTGDTGVIMDPIFGANAGQLDVTKFGWLGSVSQDTPLVVVWAASGIKTLADAMTHEVTIGGIGGTSNSSAQFVPLLNATIGTRFKVIAGYPGGKEIDLAMEKREVDGRLATYKSLQGLEPAWFQENKISLLLQINAVKSPILTDIPWLNDLVKTDADRTLVRAFESQFMLGRPYMAPPGLPPDRLKTLRVAFDETMRDSAFVEEASHYLAVAPSTGEELSRLIAEIYAIPHPIIERLMALTKVTIEPAGTP